ncbi:MAG: hypothetical protein JRE43_12165 [Deltaproteobacteria bacterium]|nr:hypothetical protein [Deltaproteobacteria bacterium]
MIASRPDRKWIAALIGVLAVACLSGCRSPGARPIGRAIDSNVRFSTRIPDVADYAAAELATAALVSDDERAERLLGRLRAIDTVLEAAGELPTGLVPVATDLVNATTDSAYAYRDATRELLESDDLDPTLRERLTQTDENNPLSLASARIRDAWVITFGRAFDALAEPIGKSIMTMSLAPYRLARSVLSYAIQVYNQEKLPLQRRQALAHWKEFVARYPDAPEVAELEPLIERGDIKLAETLYTRAVRSAQRALDTNQTRQALVYADRALDYKPEDPVATALRDEADRRLVYERKQRSRSLEIAREMAPVSAGARQLSVAMLDPGGDVVTAANELLQAEPEGPYSDEAHFAAAIALGERGEELQMWQALGEIAEEDADQSNMVRHARSLIGDPASNPYLAFSKARSQDRKNRAKWVLLGPWARGPADRRLPGPLEWAIDLPAIGQTVIAFPMRLLQLPWMRSLPTARLAAVYGRRYLDRNPDGERAAEVRDWLSAFENKRNNHIAVYNLALQDPNYDADELAELRERAAEQAEAFASREDRRDTRIAMYRRVAREYPDTRAGMRAGDAVRAEVTHATPQQIRISRGFIVENPEFAGPRGLALEAELLDGDPVNGELHPAGIVLIGGRTIKLLFIGPSGDEEDPPIEVYQKLSDERFARMVAKLEETSFRNSLLDPDDVIVADANRDVVFERARVGLSDDVDNRPAAESTYTYRGMRERYGMVRSRESILPFSLVLQGSLSDLSLGAFPRINAPRETPDAFLYR